MVIFKNHSKIFLAYFHDLVAGLAAFFVSYALRYSVTNYNVLERLPNLTSKVLIILGIQSIVFISFGLYRGVWRFSSIHDLRQIIKASFVSTVLVSLTFYLTNNMAMVPRSSMILYFCFMVLFTGGGRFIYRIFKDSSRNKSGETAIIIGAGDAGEQLVRDISKY